MLYLAALLPLLIDYANFGDLARIPGNVEMQSTDDGDQDDRMLVSPYSASSFDGFFTGPNAPAQNSTFHRYQQGDLARQTHWFAVPDHEMEQQRQHNSGFDSPYQVLGPYIIPQTGATYGQSTVQKTPTMYSPNQQAPKTFSPGNRNPTPETPGPSASYVDSPTAMGYLVQQPGFVQGMHTTCPSAGTNG